MSLSLKAAPAGAARARRRPALAWIGILSCFAAALVGGCGPASTNPNQEPEWPTVSKKWFDRARASFNALDVSDAEVSVKNALELEPDRPSVHQLAAEIALSQMRYDETLTLLEGQKSPEAAGLRARALWYAGRLGSAADELDRLLEDPDVKDPWAQGVAQLARSGAGREPFRVTGSLLAVVDMPRMPVPTLIVPLELNGDPVLALVATGTPEVVIDSTQGKPSWVSIRFGRRLEVKDVPALSRDLSSLSRRVGAPIKLLLGVNLLRRLNVTFDFYANQFVVRSFAPPPPPNGTAIDVSYIRGGGMVLRSHFGTESSAPSGSFLVDTGILFPLAMTDSGWKKAGVDPKTFETVAGEANLKQGIVPRLALGSFDLPRVPAVSGLPLSELEQEGGIHLDGVIGSALMAEFRVSLVDQGRTLWLEEMPPPEQGAPRPQGGTEPLPAPSAPPAAAPPAATPPAPAPAPAPREGARPPAPSSENAPDRSAPAPAKGLPPSIERAGGPAPEARPVPAGGGLGSAGGAKP
jgi:hypothetical protein